jgi:hypothetical protein
LGQGRFVTRVVFQVDLGGGALLVSDKMGQMLQ